MGASSAAGHANQGGTGKTVPVGGTQARKRRHQIDIPCIRDFLCQTLHILRVRNDFQPVAQPLHGGAGSKNRTFQRVTGHGALHCLAWPDPGHGGQQLVVAGYRRCTRIHQHETAGAIGVLGHAG